MRKKPMASKTNRFLFITIIADILLVSLIVYFMNYVQYLINEDVRINLSEIVAQNKDVITSKLELEVNNVDLNAKQLSDRFLYLDEINNQTIKEGFIDYLKTQADNSLSFADENGNLTDASALNKEINISSRSYYRIGMEGKSNISERLVSKLTGEEVFVICSPITCNDKVVGVVQKQYTSEQMYDLCSVSLFSEKGYTYIINQDGYILVSSRQNQDIFESDNYFRILYEEHPEDSKKLEEDIKADKSGFMETTVKDKKMFSAFSPIEKVDGWYLITSVETSAVSPNSQIAISIFYCILAGAVVFFTFSMLYYITQRRKKQQQLEKIAFVDTITGGITYAKFVIDLKDILVKNPDNTFYICVFDIDSFKYINSFYGFEVGDKILRAIHSSCSAKLYQNELIARIHSDHFVMLLTDTSADRIKYLLEAEQRFDSITIYISSGIYTITDPDESIGLMTDKATMAAQKIKGKRYNKVEFYSNKIDEQLVKNEQIKRAVEAALANDEITPFFQPKVDANTRELRGAEALARWRTKDGKMIYPSDFIPVCEKSGLITLVDMTIFEKTLQFISENLKKGINCVPISVNFSRVHLLNEDFLSTILSLLNKYDVPANLIELELTETIIFDNSAHINEFINKLHSHGLKISMDDFGSGYSSLHMLKDIDIDVLKIDRGFLLKTADSEKQLIVFGTIVEMAQKLNIKVVVEGVETEENLCLAKEFGCAIIQGYYFSKPLDEETFQKIYKSGKL